LQKEAYELGVPQQPAAQDLSPPDYARVLLLDDAGKSIKDCGAQAKNLNKTWVLHDRNRESLLARRSPQANSRSKTPGYRSPFDDKCPEEDGGLPSQSNVPTPIRRATTQSPTSAFRSYEGAGDRGRDNCSGCSSLGRILSPSPEQVRDQGLVMIQENEEDEKAQRDQAVRPVIPGTASDAFAVQSQPP